MLCLAAGPVHAGAAADAFRAGVEAAGAGDHGRALERFEAAREAGLDTPALDFNLGVSLYRLGRLEAAVAAFERAAATDAMAGPAAYNLGRIARERDDPAAAARWFRRAARRARTSALREQARAALDDLKPPPPRGWLSITAGGGHDSNIHLTPDDDVTVSGQESGSYWMLDVYGRVPLGGRHDAFAGLYAEDYRVDGDLALTSVYGGARWRGEARPWRREAWLALRHSRLGGDTFENAVAVDTEIGTAAGPGRLRLGAGGDRYQGGHDFPYLDGYRLRASARWQMPAHGGRWSLRYRLAWTDREDHRDGDHFSSYSYLGHGLRGRYRRSLGRDWTLRLEAWLEGRRYADAERRGGDTLARREETRYRLGAGLERRLGRGWRAAGRLDYAVRDSNLAAFEYERTRAELRLGRDF